MRIQDLEIENRHLRETLNDYSREFKVVRNQAFAIGQASFASGLLLGYKNSTGYVITATSVLNLRANSTFVRASITSGLVGHKFSKKPSFHSLSFLPSSLLKPLTRLVRTLLELLTLEDEP
ncbi:hypothetical protein NPIL_208201 [Nephila pilipes]|uniref:Uncharacterized protein n=1 Tax=Nephila pilipes TaxID=299642 RepID=A0A8X6NLC5_NEPPI|nr:hypothetical protein NPIL_208201 [Nephila pilipes]